MSEVGLGVGAGVAESAAVEDGSGTESPDWHAVTAIAAETSTAINGITLPELGESPLTDQPLAYGN
ncbi:hypothetical protein GCM10012278_68780 [Nonomuraea glycinis]|uniref:Uncharacterized protein n=1 Tax=Nonomuraea glycinis TaxID=2047744 RepID=A0A918AAR2_9ACTN|nr:hypothetical protein GCM10012278_68780 [Nonomuraea glycinis]